MTNRIQYRQGDVFIERVNGNLPAAAAAVPRDKGRVVLAYGEVTGHAHAIVDREAELYTAPDTNDRFRFIREIGATMLDDDPAHGKLYRYEQPDDEAVCVIEVVNASPEPIGYTAGANDVLRGGRVWKTYFLRVPPTVRTAAEGRAWTFALKADEFAPAVET